MGAVDERRAELLRMVQEVATLPDGVTADVRLALHWDGFEVVITSTRGFSAQRWLIELPGQLVMRGARDVLREALRVELRSALASLP